MKILNLKKLTLFTAAEATVVSFLIMSLIGGSLIYLTENKRDVDAKVSVLQEVEIKPTSPVAEGVPANTEKEIHTFVTDGKYRGEKFVDSVFTAVSALCVTGLTSTDFSKFTLPGQIIVMLLIQMGGLGIILFSSIFAYTIIKNLSGKNGFKNMLAGILDTTDEDVGRMIKHVVLYTLLFESLGFAVMGSYLQCLGKFARYSLIGNVNPWWWSIFHSISAFNNAGFSLMGNNLANFVLNPVINFVIASLVILGGLGYPVLIAIHKSLYSKLLKKNKEKLENLKKDTEGVISSKVQMRVAIVGTISFLSLGTLIPLLIERNNPVFFGYSWAQRFMIAFFHSASSRTAGFNTINIGAFGTASIFLYIILMYVGANPAGTAGGIKIPTVAVLYGYVKDWFKKPGEPVMLLKRRVSKFAVSHAVRLFVASIFFISMVIFFITIKEYNYLITPDATFNFTKIIFETFSAFGTVGLSMGFAGAATSFAGILSSFSKSLLIATMLFGRLGPLTILSALPFKRKYADMPHSADFDDVETIQIG
ncbi:MAG: potassium transporter TrkG [bacterium]